MKNLYSRLFKILPLTAVLLLLATKGICAQENNMQQKDRKLGTKFTSSDLEIDQVSLGRSENRLNSSRRRLLKSNNSDMITHTSWNGNEAGHNSKAAKKKAKSQKSGKSKVNKLHFDPWMGARPAKPTRKPTRRPGRQPTRKPTRRPSLTPPTPPPVTERYVEITMGGVLTANNLEPIPQSGSDQMKELARIFEGTILSSLDDVYKCIAYEIGGKPVHVGGSGIRSNKTFNRRLQDQSQVRFTLRMTKPCAGCDKAGAMIMASKVFDQTFQLLDESAKSGEMTTTFCGNAEGTGVVPSPCVVTITSAEGTSLDVKFVEDNRPTPKPTTGRPTYPPTTMPPVKWDPTPSPTLSPVTTAPTTKGGTAPPTDRTADPTPSPTDNPTLTTSPPSIASLPSITSDAPTVGVPSTISPTSIPAGAFYYTGFETGQFPNDSYWTTTEAAPWVIDKERVHSGVYSIRSPDLASDELTPRDSNVTFTTGDDFPAGALALWVLAGTQMPFDDVQYFVDGEYRGRLEGMSEWELLYISGLTSGKHNVTFRYLYNPVNLPMFPPKGDFDHIGATFIDDVSYLPFGVTLSPTSATTTVQPTMNSNPQTVAPTMSSITTIPPTSGSSTSNITSAPSASPISNIAQPTATPMVPTYAPTISIAPSDKLPTYAPTIAPSKVSPVTLAPTSAPSPNVTPPLPSPSFFDGFETGDFSKENWTITGVDAWVVDQTRPYEGLFSAHVRTEDIPESQLYSDLNLPLSLEAPGFIQFYTYAPVAQPWETYELWVDGQFLTPLTTETGEWTLAGSILGPGDHIVTWRYSSNPAGAPEDIIDSIPKPDFRLGEAWLDNVRLLAATPSFVENWDTGDFSANPWVLSEDGNWTITDEVKFEGGFSATVGSTDIEASSGTADLSIDLITEKGGTLTSKVLASVQSPFDVFEILIDGIKIVEQTDVSEDWVEEPLNIQPGKRQVTYRYVKNPNDLDGFVIESLPKDPNYEGRVWLDNIVFTANA